LPQNAGRGGRLLDAGRCARACPQPVDDLRLAGFAGGHTLHEGYVAVGSAPCSERPSASRKRPVTMNAVRLLPSGSGWFRARRSSSTAAFSSSVGIDLDVTKASARSRERRLGKTDIRKPGDLLGTDAENSGGDVTEVPELGVVHLLAEAAQRLAMLLRKTASLLSTLALGPRKPTNKILRLGRRGARLWGLWDLRPRCTHDYRHSSLATSDQKAATRAALAAGAYPRGPLRPTLVNDVGAARVPRVERHDRWVLGPNAWEGSAARPALRPHVGLRPLAELAWRRRREP
jgi:hypothetical protein